MKRILLLTLVMGFLGFVEDTSANDIGSGVLFIHNGQEYPSDSLREQTDLNQLIQSGDTIAYRRYSDEGLAEDISGSVGDDMQVVLPKGISFSAKNKTILEAFQKLEAIRNLLHSQNLGYIE